MFLLDVRLDNLNIGESLNKINDFLADGRQHYIVLPYADFLVQAQKDENFKRILNEADLSLSDGIGPVLASHFFWGEKLKTRVMGVDLIWALAAKFGAKHSIFLFGAKNGVAQEMARNIFQKLPEVKISGIINGFISDEKAIGEINDKKPEILLVALGMPKQEKWIYDNLKKIPSVKLAIGVGGAFDFISGRTHRAPQLVQEIGMEWLWRLFTRPSQWRKTWRSVIIFPIIVFKELLFNRKKSMKIHFIGIGGIGVSALVRYFLARGETVSGSDATGSGITEELEKLGAKIFLGHRQENLDSRFRGNDSSLDLVIFSAAVQEDNPELVEARKQGIKCQKYAQALGEITKEKFTIAVSGMHGKSTTTAMIGLMMEQAGLDPTVIVGTKVSEWGNSNFRAGKSQYLVIEADEYDRSFLNYWPKILVLLNIEEEHLDTYIGGLSDIMKTFGEYVGHLSGDGVLVANEEDENVAALVNPKSQFPNPNFRIEKYNSKNERGLKLKIPGRHNIGNANAALSVAKILEISDSIADKVLNEFNGTWRRMEYKGEYNGAKIYDDYGHHPTEVKATLAGARELLASNGKLWCIFQPHQYHRTYDLFDQFVDAFADADKTIILPIYSVVGRESEEIKQKVSSEKLAERISGAGKEVLFMEDFDKVVKYLKENLQSGDVCLIMGAGDIYKLTSQLV